MKGKEWKIWRISDIMYEFSDEDFSRIETCSKEGYINLILLTWRIGWAHNKASKWQMGFNLAFKGLIELCF